MTSWFQVTSPRSIQFNRFTLTDFKNIKSLGADVIRLPINLHAMTRGEPDYVLDSLFLEFLDQAVDMAEKSGIHIILDNHSFNSSIPTDPDIEQVLLKVWPQMAAHFKTRSGLVVYEILNEPHGINAEKWGLIQGNVINAIRKIDTTHAIIVGAANYNNIHDLKTLPEYTDTNLIYTFHFYDPMVFTHQGATFTGTSLGELKVVPWPPASGDVPPVPQSLKGTGYEWQPRNYAREGGTEKIETSLAEAVKFAADRKVRIFCGEYGVLKTAAHDVDRIRWYREVREYLEKAGIPWTTWDYHGSFGPFKSVSGGRFDYDLNIPLVQALGFIAPAQKEWLKTPATGNVPVYDDYPAAGIITSGWQKTGSLDFYASKETASGKYLIVWKDASRYDSFLFSFPNAKDLSALVSTGYALEFMARTNSEKIKFDIRFMNSDDSPADIPWRKVLTVDSKLVPPDNAWHLVRIPLSSMVDAGAWKQSQQKWFNPSGKFSWANVVSLQISAEEESLAGIEIVLDDIRVEQ